MFLCYAREDSAQVDELEQVLREAGFPVWRDTADLWPGQNWRANIQRAITDGALVFLACFSSRSLARPVRYQNAELALAAEQARLHPAGDSWLIPVRFDRCVLPELDLGGGRNLGEIQRADLFGDRADTATGRLVAAVAAVLNVVPDGGIRTPTRVNEKFLDRIEELERVLHALNNPSGAHFWLVIGPPGLGKSWFLKQLESKAAQPAAGGWVSTMVDLRHGEEVGPDEAGQKDESITVLRRLFDLEQPTSSEPEYDHRRVAQKIIRAGRPWLCLLDGAELLQASTVARLRQHLGGIHRLIQGAGNAHARLAFVVGSRRYSGWGGLAPYPRLSVLPLTGFEFSVVQDALEGLARRMPAVHSGAELRKDAALIQHATKGMPELVQRSLQWIHAEEWLEIERLNSPQLFGEIVAPYIRERLLTQDSLLPGQRQLQNPAKQLDVLQRILRALVPYRFITLSHVHYHLDNDCSFRDALNDANWSPEDLWQAISNMTLLLRPLDEPWLEIHPTIRRLLYRYFYAPGERTGAHCEARDFTKGWARQLTGKDQIIGLVESIWHEAARLRLSSAATMEEELPSFARELSRDVCPSTYTKTELRDYAAQRIEADDEIQREVANVDGLFEALVGIIRFPETSDV